jgi:hypothetical protein
MIDGSLTSHEPTKRLVGSVIFGSILRNYFSLSLVGNERT